MTSMLQKLGIDRLSPQERMELIGEIWDSLDPDQPFEISQSHREELDRRIADADANPSVGSTWEEVKARILQRKLPLTPQTHQPPQTL